MRGGPYKHGGPPLSARYPPVTPRRSAHATRSPKRGTALHVSLSVCKGLSASGGRHDTTRRTARHHVNPTYHNTTSQHTIHNLKPSRLTTLYQHH